LLGNLALAEIWPDDCAFLFMYFEVKQSQSVIILIWMILWRALMDVFMVIYCQIYQSASSLLWVWLCILGGGGLFVCLFF